MMLFTGPELLELARPQVLLPPTLTQPLSCAVLVLPPPSHALRHVLTPLPLGLARPQLQQLGAFATCRNVQIAQVPARGVYDCLAAPGASTPPRRLSTSRLIPPGSHPSWLTPLLPCLAPASKSAPCSCCARPICAADATRSVCAPRQCTPASRSTRTCRASPPSTWRPACAPRRCAASSKRTAPTLLRRPPRARSCRRGETRRDETRRREAIDHG